MENNRNFCMLLKNSGGIFESPSYNHKVPGFWVPQRFLSLKNDLNNPTAKFLEEFLVGF